MKVTFGGLSSTFSKTSDFLDDFGSFLVFPKLGLMDF